jgi:hypothetical protein
MSVIIKTKPDARTSGKIVRVSGKAVRISRKGTRIYIEAVRGFRKGINLLTFIQDISPREISPGSAWSSVGGAFRSAGNSLRKAIYEQPAPTRKKTK